MSTGGAGINTSAVNQALDTSKSPYAPATGDINNLLSYLGNYTGNPANTVAENTDFSNAIKNVNQLPNFGPAGAYTAENFLQQANQNPDPTQTPGMANVLKTIQSDTENAVNSQFAGAGRSLSGLNTQDLSRGLAQGEAVPLLNQYNQNIANEQGLATSGLNAAAGTPGLASSVPLMSESIANQQVMQPFAYMDAGTNIANTLGGMGGTSVGTGQTQNTASLLSALSGLFGGANGGTAGGISGIISSLFGGG